MTRRRIVPFTVLLLLGFVIGWVGATVLGIWFWALWALAAIVEVVARRRQVRR